MSRMTERDRVARLRTLAAELERVPPSDARDALLLRIRRRAGLLEGGLAPVSAWAPDATEPARASSQAEVSSAIASELRAWADASPGRSRLVIERGSRRTRPPGDDRG